MTPNKNTGELIICGTSSNCGFPPHITKSKSAIIIAIESVISVTMSGCSRNRLRRNCSSKKANSAIINPATKTDNGQFPVAFKTLSPI